MRRGFEQFRVGGESELPVDATTGQRVIPYIVDSVRIEKGEFVAILLNGSTRSRAEAKILVGPRGTFAYVLTLGDARRSGHGGTEDRLVCFPDNESRAKFEESGWTPQSEGKEAE